MKKILLIILSAVLFLANLSYASIERQQIKSILVSVNNILEEKSGDPGSVVCQSLIVEAWLKPLNLQLYYGDSDILKLSENKTNLIRTASIYAREDVNLKASVINIINNNSKFQPPTDLTINNFNNYLKNFSEVFKECVYAKGFNDINEKVDKDNEVTASVRKRYNLLDANKRKVTVYLNYQELKMYLNNGYSSQ